MHTNTSYMPPCLLAHWLQRCRTSQTVASGVWKSTGMTRDWPSQAMMMATKLKHILTRYALMKPHFIAAFVARGPWPTFIPVLNCCCQGYFVIWNLKTHEAERVLSCISAARRRRASMDGRWNHVFLGQGKVGMILSVCADWTKMRMLVGHGEACWKFLILILRTEFCRTPVELWVGLPFFLCPRTTIWICWAWKMEADWRLILWSNLANFTSTLCRPCRFIKKVQKSSTDAAKTTRCF